MSIRIILMLVSGLPLLAAGGCATPRAAAPARPATAPAASGNVHRPDAMLALGEIEPNLDLAALAPTSRPSARPPIEAVTLFARATDALQTNRRFTAINLLEKALELDPRSFDLNYALGRAHVIGRTHDDNSIVALERAAAIEPDHLELQTSLGRQYLACDDLADALKHLRLAVQTTAYRADEPGAGTADLFLGRALQQAGYDRAALGEYATLLRRVRGHSLSLRREPHLAFLITDQLYVDIGDLYARNGQFEDALAAFEPAAARDPSNFDLDARVVRAMLGLRRFDDASRRAADAVVRFRADKTSLDLLREASRARAAATGDKDGLDGAADALIDMHAQRPDDTAVLFALVELLREDGRWAQAEGLLAAQSAHSPADFAVIHCRVRLWLERDDPEGAARLLVETLAAQPDFADEIDALWPDVVSPARPNHMRLAQFESLPVLPWQIAARELSVATVAGQLRRTAVSEQALRRAVTITPPFAPAFRARLVQIWQDADEAEKTRQTDELIARAGGAETALSQELSALAALFRKPDATAARALAKAVESAGESPPPSLLLAYASALRATAETSKFESLLWKLLSDRPTFEGGYAALYDYYTDTRSDSQADRVLNTWLTSVPYSTPARLLQGARHFRAGRAGEAESLFARLLEERGDDPGVLRTAFAFYARAGKVDALTSMLEERLSTQAGNLAALGLLVELYDQKNRVADSIPLLDAARQAMADDPDYLYQVAHLYARVDREDVTEDVLRQVLALDPAHPPASNDLGYTWAERGENLARAEALIRQAVESEPGNASFLDSLGWVLYKRGKFAEARPNLEKAAGDGQAADPVVLDHLGDVLYRLGDRAAAAKQWEQAGAKLAEMPPGRADLKRLKTELERKAAQLKSGSPVTVSPIVDEARQAKN